MTTESRWVWYSLVWMALFVAYLATVSALKRQEQTQRIHLHELDVIAARLRFALQKGTPVPTNWMTLVRAIDREAPPSMTNSFSVLETPQPAAQYHGTGLVLLASSKAERLSGRSQWRGRWALVLFSNDVRRVFLSEAGLGEKTVTQLEKPVGQD